MAEFTFNDKGEILINGEWLQFRSSYAVLGEERWNRAAALLELQNWENELRFCPKCAEPLESGKPKVCGRCGSEYWPQLNPAIVVLVTRGENRDGGLLVHARTLKGNVHALVAGFVEPGESLEECVAREVKEETGLEISDISYFGSQSWPYPHQMMVAFTARLVEPAPEISFPDGELTSGGFFDRRDRASLPELPSPPSLTNRLIESWLSGKIK